MKPGDGSRIEMSFLSFTSHVNHFLLSLIDNQLLPRRDLSHTSPLCLASWQGLDSRVRPAIIFLFETVKSREIVLLTARGRGGEEGGQLPGGRAVEGRPGQDGGQEGRLLVLLDQQSGGDCQHLPSVQAGALRELPDGERGEGQHGVYGGEGEVVTRRGGWRGVLGPHRVDALYSRVRLAVNQV